MFDRTGKTPIPGNWPNAHITEYELLGVNHPVGLDITEPDEYKLGENRRLESGINQTMQNAAQQGVVQAEQSLQQRQVTVNNNVGSGTGGVGIGDELATPPLLAGIKKRIGSPVGLLWEQTGPAAFFVKPKV